MCLTARRFCSLLSGLRPSFRLQKHLSKLVTFIFTFFSLTSLTKLQPPLAAPALRRSDVDPVGRSDMMFAHYVVKRTITHTVNITAKGYITCPQGQTSFKKAYHISVISFFV